MFFLTINTALPANNSLRFWKKSFRFIEKMTLINKLDDKIKANQAQGRSWKSKIWIFSIG